MRIGRRHVRHNRGSVGKTDSRSVADRAALQSALRRDDATTPARVGGTCVALRRAGMHYLALATDYDGTLAEDGAVRPEVLASLVRLKESGRKLVLVTGRVLDELIARFPAIDVFDRVVAENGALLYTPSGPRPRERALAEPPPPELAEALRVRGVTPLVCGRVIVATRQPYEQVVRTVIREQGLELELIFNKGALMVLPSGVDKATGLISALDELGLDRARVVGVGDAENDHSLLDVCGLGVAVANAVPALLRRADLVMAGARGDGVIELCEQIVATDLADVAKKNEPPGGGSRRLVT